MKNEVMVYVILGTLLYFIGYLTIGTTITHIWSMWAMRKTNVFLRYNLSYDMKRLYPEYYWFTQEHNKIYSVLYVCFWPIMMPIQLKLMTNCVHNSLERCYFYN